MTRLNEDQLRATMQVLHPTAVPSERLEAKVAALASAAQPRFLPPRRRPIALGLAMVTGVFGIAIAGFLFFAPKLALATTMRSVSSNLLRTPGLHYRLTHHTRGKVALTREVWQTVDQWRQDSELNGKRFSQIKTGGKFWDYDPATHTAWYQSDHSSEPLGLMLEQLLTQMQQALRAAKGEDLGREMRNGRQVQTVAVPGPVQASPHARTQPGRTIFRLDLNRMLPMEMEQQVRSMDGWTTVLHVRYDLDQPVSQKTFTQPLQGARIFDLNTYGAEIGKRYRRSLAVQRFASRRIVLRDVQVGRDGDLFVLYTDGSTRARSLVSFGKVFTDSGMPYAQATGAIEPYMCDQNPESSRGITVDGEIMRSLCAVPLAPQADSPAPHHLVVEIEFKEYRGKESVTRHARFTVPRPRRRNELLPAYATDLAVLSLSGGDADRFRKARERARRSEFRDRRDWAGLIRSSDQAMQSGVTDVSTYLDRAEAFRQSGQFPNARQAIQKAYAEDESGFSDGQISQAERQLDATERNPAEP